MPFLELPDAKLAYLDMERAIDSGAQASAVVLLHGLAANIGFWYLHSAPALAAHHRVALIDLRGHGRSSMPRSGYAPDSLAEDLRQLLDHLNIDAAHIVGHSYGGNVALHFAQRFPARTRSLALADVRLRSVQPRLDSRLWASWPRYRQSLKSVGLEVNESSDELGLEIFERLARLRIERPDLAERITGIMPSPFSGPKGSAAARRWLRLMDTTSAKLEFSNGERLRLADMGAIMVDTLLIYGEFSHALPTGRALDRDLPRARLEVVPRVGHFFPMTYPDKLVQPLLAFLSHHDRQVCKQQIRCVAHA